MSIANLDKALGGQQEVVGPRIVPGRRQEKVSRFGITSCYQVNLDMMTGKYTRKALFSNKDIPTCMPRLGSVMSNTMWVTGKDDRMLAKSKVVVGKIVCAD